MKEWVRQTDQRLTPGVNDHVQFVWQVTLYRDMAELSYVAVHGHREELLVSVLVVQFYLMKVGSVREHFVG